MAKTIRPPKRLILQPPLVPVIDVVFNLLIFFMCIPNAAAGAGYLTTNLPKDGGVNQGEPEIFPKVKIALESADGHGNGVFITLGDTDSLGDNFGQLAASLDSMRARGLAPNYPILLAPTSEVKLKYIVSAFDAVVAAQFSNIQFQCPTYSRD